MDSMPSMSSMTAMDMTGSTLSAPMPTGKGKSMPGMNMSSMGDMDMSCKISMLWNWNTIGACFISKGWHIKSHGMFAGSCIGVILLVVCLELLRRMGREYDAFILRRARMRQTYLSGSSFGISAPLFLKKIKRQSKLVHAEGSSKTPARDNCYSQPESADDLITPVPELGGATHSAKDGDSTTVDVTANGVEQAQRSAVNIAVLPPYRPSIIEQIVRAFLHTLQFAVAYFVMLLAMYYNGYIIICIFIGAFVGSLIFSWEPISLSKENDATAVTKCCG